MKLLTEWMRQLKQIVWVSINGVGCRSLKTSVKWSELVNSPILFTFLKSFSKLSTPKAHHRHPRTENPHITIHQPFFYTVYSTIIDTLIDTQITIIDTLGDDLSRILPCICELRQYFTPVWDNSVMAQFISFLKFSKLSTPNPELPIPRVSIFKKSINHWWIHRFDENYKLINSKWSNSRFKEFFLLV